MMKTTLSILVLITALLFNPNSLHAQFALGLPTTIAENDNSGNKIIQLADLNGDSFPDIFSASTVDANIIWYPNLGDGSFGEPIPIANDAVVAEARVIDLDKDGDLDLVFGQFSTDAIVWLSNNGDGSFGAAQVIFSMTWSFDKTFTFEIADINLDGYLDFVIVCAVCHTFIGGTVFSLINDGNYVFSEPTRIVAYADYNGLSIFAKAKIVITDIDNNGYLDVIIGTAPESAVATRILVIKYYWSAPNLTLTQVINNARSFQVSDVNNDGFADLIYVNTENNIFWKAGGTYAEFGGNQNLIQYDYIKGKNNLVDDLNEDGTQDIALWGEADNAIHLYMRRGIIYSKPPIVQTIKSDTLPKYVQITDLDNDGHKDLFIVFTDNKIVWHRNQKDMFGLPREVVTTSTEASHVVSGGDFDSDGDIDIVMGYSSNGRIAVLLNDGLGNFTETDTLTDEPETDIWVLTTADINNDGHLDIVWGSNCKNKIGWYENDGNANFNVKHEILLNVVALLSLEVSDLDADGHLDFVFTSYEDGKIAWCKNLGGGIFGELQLIDEFPYWVLFCHLTDFDGDNDADILVTFQDWYYTLVAYVNDGNGNFNDTIMIEPSNSSFGPHYRTTSANLNNDACMDPILISGQLTPYDYCSSSWVPSERSVLVSMIETGKAIPVNINHDEHIDILFWNSPDFNSSFYNGAEGIGWLENDGNGQFTVWQPIATFSDDYITFGGFAGDFDGDDDIDVFGVGYYPNSYAVWFEQMGSVEEEEEEEETEEEEPIPPVQPVIRPAQLQVIPNPAHLATQVLLPEAVENGDNIQLVIYNLYGNIVSEIEVQAQDFVKDIDLASMHQGLYIITLNIGGKTIDRCKLVVANQ